MRARAGAKDRVQVAADAVAVVRALAIHFIPDNATNVRAHVVCASTLPDRLVALARAVADAQAALEQLGRFPSEQVAAEEYAPRRVAALAAALMQRSAS